MAKCAILGASGHGRVVAELAELSGYSDIDFFDDHWPKLTKLERWKVIGKTQNLLDTVLYYDGVIVAIGDNNTRLFKQTALQNAGAKLVTFIHPAATVSPYATLAAGCVVMANAVVNPYASVGHGCIINTSSIIEHDCILGDGVHICPGAKLAGGVRVGNLALIGIGAQIIQMRLIGQNSVVGAGATVIQNVSDGKIVIGTPAKELD